MEDRFIPISNHIKTNLVHWTLPYRPILRNPNVQIQDMKFVISLLHWTMRHFIWHAGLIEHGRFVFDKPRESYPSYHKFDTYVHLVADFGLVIAHNHDQPTINPYELNNKSAFSPQDINDLQQLVSSYHGHESVLLSGLHDVRALTDRLVEHDY